jgi:hypothetical protein
MYPERKNMCTWKDAEFSDDDRRKTRTESTRSGSTGAYERVTRYPDGSSTWHCGGPCGDVHYDQYGEEC